VGIRNWIYPLKCHASTSLSRDHRTAIVNCTFAGWSVDADCLDGKVNMSGNLSCTAFFRRIGFDLKIARTGNGSGKVTASPASIDCGNTCTAEFSQNAVVKLTPSPAPGSAFSGWSGDPDCSRGTVTINGDKSCTATFSKVAVARIGLYRPSTGSWFLMDNDSGNSKIGVYDVETNSWVLDGNRDGTWRDCATDRCRSFSLPRTSNSNEIPLETS